MLFSIIIPVYNESQNIKLLVEEILGVLEDKDFEIIIVDDKSSDNTAKILNNLKIFKKIKIVFLSKRSGQSYAIKEGIINSSSNIIVTIDGDGQNDPKDILNLYKFFNKSNYSLVGGIREKRKDNYLKIISSILANKFRSFVLKDNCKDTGCGLKIFYKDKFLSFPYFNGIHRFLPALFSGFDYETFFIKVNHRPRVYGQSNYGTIKRLIYGVRDIFFVRNIIGKQKK